MNVLITGSRSGIARQVMEQLGEEYYIYAGVKTENELDWMRNHYQSRSNVEPILLDITNEEHRNQASRLEIDILISNAAVGYGGSVLEMDMDCMRDNFEVNVFSNMELVQQILQGMVKKDSGRVIIMSSLAGIVPIPFLGSYCATKASLITLASTLRSELAKIHSNVFITLIEPGMYHTGFNQVMFQDKYDRDSFYTYFKSAKNIIQSEEYWLQVVLEKKNLDSIVRKVICAIKASHPKKVYQAPLLQAIGAKLYKIVTK